MARFKLLTATVTFRGEVFTVQQFTAQEKMQWHRASQKDPEHTLALMAAMGTKCEPPLTLKGLLEEPTAFIEVLADKIAELNGESDPVPDEKKAD